MHKRKLIALLVVLLLLTGCASTGSSPTDSAKATAWKTLMTNKVVYDKSFTALAELDKQKKLPAAVKKDALAAGNAYVLAHNLAVQALLDNKLPSLSEVGAKLDVFLALVVPYTGGK